MTGNERELDFIIANDLIGSGFQPENTLKVLEKGWKVTYFSYDSTIKEYIKKAKELLNEMDVPYVKKQVELKKLKKIQTVNHRKLAQYIPKQKKMKINWRKQKKA